MKTTVLLESLCETCTCGAAKLFVARLYSETIDSHIPFKLLPKFKGACILHVKGQHVHVSALSIHNGKFLSTNYLDLCLRTLEAAPMVETASWERHKDEEIKRTIRIVDTIRILTKRISNNGV